MAYQDSYVFHLLIAQILIECLQCGRQHGRLMEEHWQISQNIYQEFSIYYLQTI